MSTLTFLGDVWPTQAFLCQAALPGRLILNLESPITRATQAAPGKICLKTQSNHLRSIFGESLLAVCLANNHILDYGPAGLDDTLAQLQQARIGYFGAGPLAANCHNPLLLELEGPSVALLGYVCASTHPIFASPSSPGVLPIELDRLRADITALKGRGLERIVVLLHWGLEELHLPRPQDILLAHALVDAGADLIIGHHAHCIQRYELYRQKPIFYGLGNCLFPDFDFSPHTSPAGSAAWKKQRYWNRRSLAVSWDSASGQVSLSGLVFSAGRLRSSWRRPRPLGAQAPGPSLSGYSRHFTRHARLMALRLAGSRFLAQPRVPRLSHLKALLGLAPQAQD